jgi:hypothetical protein
MNHRTQLQSILLLAILALTTANASFAETASPLPASPFSIPMTDKTTATAMFLPAPNGATYLVIATPTGKLGFWTMTATTPPNDPTPLDPIKPPVDPPKPAPTLARLVTITTTTPAAIAADVAAALAAKKATYSAYTIAQVAQPDTTADALTWIGKSAGKTLPYSFAVDTAGHTIAEGPTPTTAAAMTAFLTNQVPTAIIAPAVTQPPPTCPAGCTNCQPQPILKGRRR